MGLLLKMPYCRRRRVTPNAANSNYSPDFNSITGCKLYNPN